MRAQSMLNDAQSLHVICTESIKLSSAALHQQQPLLAGAIVALGCC